jgi:hypothetical protein
VSRGRLGLDIEEGARVHFDFTRGLAFLSRKLWKERVSERNLDWQMRYAGRRHGTDTKR